MKDNSYLKSKIPSKAILEKMNEYWNATNFLSATQLYLLDNPLLQRTLTKEDVKGRIVGPWGSAPGQNLVYVHLNRAIKKHNLNMMLLSGPGHGGIFWTANTYLDGSMAEKYPDITNDKKGLQKLNKQFCFPGGVSSHVAPDMVGSMHEGGELGYVLSHAFGAVFDNPSLIATAIVGDGEAETGPLATSWHSNKFLNPITDGAVLPILHLNGFKVFNPTVLSRIPNKQLAQLFLGYGWQPIFVEGSNPMTMHKKMANAVEKAVCKILAIQKHARKKNDARRPIWPMIILRTPKGWTSPKEIDGKLVEGTHNAYHAPYDMKQIHHIVDLEKWLKSYHPEELFNENGEFRKDLKALAPKGNKRLGANQHANGGQLLKPLKLPSLKNYAIQMSGHGVRKAQDTTVLSTYMRDVIKKNPNNFRIMCPDEMDSNKMSFVYEATNNVFNAKIVKNDEAIARSGRVMDSYLSEHTCEGWLEGYLLTGRHGTFVSYAAFARIIDSMLSQHAKWLKMSKEIFWRADIASLNLVLTSHAWLQDHNGYSHQEPGLFDFLANKKSDIVRMFLPPDANCLLCVYDDCLKSRNKINAIVCAKNLAWQWLSLEEAEQHCKNGIGVWHWAGKNDIEPDVVIACAGDLITLEAVAASEILQKYLPKLNIRFVNVVNIMKLAKKSEHPDGLTDAEYDKIFTTDKPIIFNYHGYPSFIHTLTYARNNTNLTVCGYVEEGHVSTNFDIRVQNKVDRFHLVKTVLSKLKKTATTQKLDALMDETLKKHKKYIEKYGVDLPCVENWKFGEKNEKV